MTIRNDGGLLIDEGRGCCVGFLFNFEGHGIFSPDGRVEAITPEQAETHNKLLSEALITGLDTNCEVGQGGTFYYSPTKGVTTWVGTLVSNNVTVHGQSIKFSRNGKRFRGRLRKDADCFNFRRIA